MALKVEFLPFIPLIVGFLLSIILHFKWNYSSP